MKDLFGESEDPFSKTVNSSSENTETFEPVEQEREGNEDALPDGRVTYTPAMDVKVSDFFVDSAIDLGIGDKRLTWWEEESLVPQHPYLLINPVAWAQGAPPADDIRDEINISPRSDQFVFVDSGGFQIASQGGISAVSSPDIHDFEEGQIYPPKLLEWQARNGTAGSILDTPPFVAEDRKIAVEDTFTSWYQNSFKNALEQTIVQTQPMVDRYETLDDDEYAMYGVVHGAIDSTESDRPHYSYLEWMDEIKKLHSFDGWCLGSVPEMGLIPVVMRAVLDNCTAKNIHLLGTGSLLHKMAASYFMLWEDDVSFTMDSTSFATGSRYRIMSSPMMSNSDFTVTSREPDTQQPIKPDVYPCRCVVCEAVNQEKGETYLLDVNNASASLSIDMHNLHFLLQRMKTITALITSEGKDLVEDANPYEDEYQSVFWKTVRDMMSKGKAKEIYDTMRFTRLLQESGFDAAYDEFEVNSRFADGGRSIQPRRSMSVTDW